jgi:hypothetical protein
MVSVTRPATNSRLAPSPLSYGHGTKNMTKMASDRDSGWALEEASESASRTTRERRGPAMRRNRRRVGAGRARDLSKAFGAGRQRILVDSISRRGPRAGIWVGRRVRRRLRGGARSGEEASGRLMTWPIAARNTRYGASWKSAFAPCAPARVSWQRVQDYDGPHRGCPEHGAARVEK